MSTAAAAAWCTCTAALLLGVSTTVIASAVPQRMITLIVPYYNQHALIYDQFRRWSNYSADIQSNIEAIIVDDGSKREPLRTVFAQAEEAGDLPAIMPVLAVQLHEDIGFNHGGACNTGSLYARGKFLLFADTDHWFTPVVMERILALASTMPADRYFYSAFTCIDASVARTSTIMGALTQLRGFRRVEWVKEHMAGSPNTMLMSKSLFEASRGYDEDFSGPYGFNDNIFQYCLFKRFGLRRSVFGWNMGKGLWAVYASAGGTSGFSRNTTENANRWKAKKALRIYCNEGPLARVPHGPVGKHLWTSDTPGGERRQLGSTQPQ